MIIITFIITIKSNKKKDFNQTKEINEKDLVLSESELNWDLYFECIKRIWQPFWTNLLKNDEDFMNTRKTTKIYIEDEVENIDLSTISDRIDQFIEIYKDPQVSKISIKKSLNCNILHFKNYFNKLSYQKIKFNSK